MLKLIEKATSFPVPQGQDLVIEEYAGKVKVGKMDVDTNPQIPGKFGIRNIPTIIFFKDGKVVNTIIGAQTKNTLEAELKKLL